LLSLGLQGVGVFVVGCFCSFWANSCLKLKCFFNENFHSLKKKKKALKYTNKEENARVLVLLLHKRIGYSKTTCILLAL